MSKSTGPRDPLLDDPAAFIFTDGCSPQRLGRMGSSHHFPGHSGDPCNMGTCLHLPSSNTGELSALYHALDWIRKRRKSLDPASSPRYNLVSDSFYCVKLFATCAIKPVANKHIIARINTLLNQVKRDNSISTSWTPAHTNSDDPLAQGNAEQVSSRLEGVRPPTS